MRPADSDWYEKSWMYSARPTSRPLPLEDILRTWAWNEFLSTAATTGKGTILDVACGEGHFLHAARCRGFKVRGVDINPRLVETARGVYGLDVACQDLAAYLDDCRANHRRFDYVTAFEILEHVADPVGVLRSFASVGAGVAVSVPCAERRPALFGRAVDAPPHHLTLWSKEALLRALGAAGFTPVHVSGEPYAPKHLAMHLSCLVGGGHPLQTCARALARRAGYAFGRFMRGTDSAPFTLFALARTQGERRA
jgi:SAM-dependent methyltransferase